MELQELRLFARVAELRSFTRAAEQLGIAKGRASAGIQQLESRMGTRLLQRTTRQVRLTADGEQFLERCLDLLADAEQLQAMFQPAAAGLRGRLRIDLPTRLVRDVVMPRLPEFLAAHPLLEVGVSATDSRVDVVRGGYDCVVRVGPLADSGLVARPLGWLPVCNAASPAYLKTHGTPRRLADLDRHRVVHYSARLSAQGAAWDYREAGASRSRPMRAALVVNSIDAYEAACLAGLGLIQAPRRGLASHLAAGRLVEILPAHTGAPMPVTLLYPHRRLLPARVQAMLHWLAGVVGEGLDADSFAAPAPAAGRARRRAGP